MGFWFWFWIWLGLGFLSLAVFAWIGWELFTKVTPIFDQLKVSSEYVKPLLSALEKPVNYAAPTSALDSDPEAVFAERASVVRRNRDRTKARERRLIRSLLDIDVNESRFTNAP